MQDIYVKEPVDLIMFQIVCNLLIELCNEYTKVNGIPNLLNESSNFVFGASVTKHSIYATYKKFKIDKGAQERTSKLEKCLAEEDENEMNLDVFVCWKLNSS